MALPTETVTFAGSGIVFNNTYDDGVTAQVRTAIIAAENYLQAHFTDTVTLNVTFNFDHLGPDKVANNISTGWLAPYAGLVAAMSTHATTADDRIAIAGLPTTDPSNGAGFVVAPGLAQVLGLQGPSGGTDVTVNINADQAWTFGSDLIGTVEHELSEGGFGRIQGLGVAFGSRWFPLDLFRFKIGRAHV